MSYTAFNFEASHIEKITTTETIWAYELEEAEDKLREKFEGKDLSDVKLLSQDELGFSEGDYFIGFKAQREDEIAVLCWNSYLSFMGNFFLMEELEYPMEPTKVYVSDISSETKNGHTFLMIEFTEHETEEIYSLPVSVFNQNFVSVAKYNQLINKLDV